LFRFGYHFAGRQSQGSRNGLGRVQIRAAFAKLQEADISLVQGRSFRQRGAAQVFLFAVFLRPQNFFVQNVVTGLQLQLTGTPNFPYTLQSATNLTPPITWKSVRTINSDANGNWQYVDTNLNSGQKFYRAVGQ
jgi:hypothetical protein